MGYVKECWTDRFHCLKGLPCWGSSKGMLQARQQRSTTSTSKKLPRGHTEEGSAGGMSCLEGTPASPCTRFHHTVPDLTTTIESRYLCRRHREQSFSTQQLLTVQQITGNRATATHHRRRSFHPGGGSCREPRFSSLIL
jgi:hypothetical protein